MGSPIRGTQDHTGTFQGHLGQDLPQSTEPGVPVGHSEAASKTEDYQLLGEVLDQGPKELGYSREDLSVELFASDKQHVLDLYCSKGKNCSYKFYWPSSIMSEGSSFDTLRYVEVCSDCSSGTDSLPFPWST